MNLQEKGKEKPVELFEFRTEYDPTNNLKNTNHRFFEWNTGLISTRKHRWAKRRNNARKSDISRNPFCFTGSIPEFNVVAAIPQKLSIGWPRNYRTTSECSKTQFSFAGSIPEINDVVAIPQDQSTSSSSQSEDFSAMEIVSKARLKFYPSNKGYQNITFKCDAHLENTFFFSNSRCIKIRTARGHISTDKKYTIELTNIYHQEVKVSTVQNAPLPIDFPCVHSFEKERSVVSNVLIQSVSQVKEVMNTMKITNSCPNKSKASSSTSENLPSEKYVSLNDPVYELIRQQRLSWFLEDDRLPNFKSQFKQNCFYESNRRDFCRANSEAKNICYNKSQRKLRVRKLEKWQSEMILSSDESPRLGSKERIVMKPKDKESISWRSKLSDESELDDSGSSLDGSFLRSGSDSSDSSDCESFTCSGTSYTSYRNHSAPPTSSRIFGDSIAESETAFLKTFREQFWHSDLVRNADKHFIEDFGFISVALQALQCLCQYSDNGAI